MTFLDLTTSTGYQVCIVIRGSWKSCQYWHFLVHLHKQEYCTKVALQDYRTYNLSRDGTHNLRLARSRCAAVVEQIRGYFFDRSGPSSARSSARKMIDLEEEELKYLKFVNEVTEDILSTGVYSDRLVGITE